MNFNIEKAVAQCSDLNIKRVINKLVPYNRYLYLVETTQEDYKIFLNDLPGEKPEQIKAWYSLFNGGMLFDTLFLSTKFIDSKSCASLVRLQNIDGKMVRAQMELPAYMTVFALSSFGDVYCYNNQGLNEIYQWSIAEHKLVYKWMNFALWLNDEIGIAIELVTENILLPTGYNVD